MSRPSIILLLSLMPMLASVQAVLTAADAAYEKELGLLAEPFDYEAHLTRCWACAEAEGLTDERASIGVETVGRFGTPAGGFARSDATLPIDVRLCFRRLLMEEQHREASRLKTVSKTEKPGHNMYCCQNWGAWQCSAAK